MSGSHQDPHHTKAHAVQSVLLLDENDNIVHGHQESFLGGASQKSPAELEEAARRAFTAMNPSKSVTLHARHVTGPLTDHLPKPVP